MNDYEESIVANVREFGWHCTSVVDSEGRTPSFSYSVGFSATLGCPEFIMFGLATDHMFEILWRVFERLRDGERVGDGRRWSDLLVGYDCVSRRVDPSNIVPDYLNSAIWYRERAGLPGPVEAYQLVWPDEPHGRFPWDPECDSDVCELQPALYLPRSPSL